MATRNNSNLLFKAHYDIGHWVDPDYVPERRFARTNNATFFGATTREEVLRRKAAGASVDERDDRGRTALFYARSIEVVQTLLDDCQADLDVTDRDGCTPIFVTPGDGDVISYLIERGCDPDAQDVQGNTVLHTTKDPVIVEVMLAQGAVGAFTKRNNAGLSPTEAQIAALKSIGTGATKPVVPSETEPLEDPEPAPGPISPEPLNPLPPPPAPAPGGIVYADDLPMQIPALPDSAGPTDPKQQNGQNQQQGGGRPKSDEQANAEHVADMISDIAEVFSAAIQGLVMML